MSLSRHWTKVAFIAWLLYWIAWHCTGCHVIVSTPLQFLAEDVPLLRNSLLLRLQVVSGQRVRVHNGCHIVLLCNLASSVSPPHGAPIHSFPLRWNDSSNSPSLHRGGGSNYVPPLLQHTHSDKAAGEPEKNCLCSIHRLLWLHSCSHLALTGSPGLSYKLLWCVTGAIQA